MPTFKELLEANQPDAVSTMKNVADKSDLSKLLTNPMSAEEIEALNQSPEILEKMNQAAQGNFPSPETPPPPAPTIEGPGVPVGEPKSIGPDYKKLMDDYKLSKNRAAMVGETQDLTPTPEQLKENFMNRKNIRSTPDISGKLTQVEEMAKRAAPVTELGAGEKAALSSLEGSGSLSGLIEKLNYMPNEALAKLGSLGKKVMESRAMQTAGKIANSPAGKIAGKGLGILTVPAQAMAAKSSFDKGDYMDSAADSAGVASTIAALAGSSVALPLGLGAASYQAGKKLIPAGASEEDIAKFRAAHANDPMAPSIGPGGLMPPEQNNGMQLASGSVPPTSGMGPFADPNKYHPEGENREPAEEPKQSSNGTQDGNNGGVLSSPPILDNSEKGFTDNTVAGLKKVQDDANRRRDQQDLMDAANLMSSGLLSNKYVHLKPDYTLGDKYRKGADQMVTDYQARAEKEKDDSGSAASMKMQKFSKEILQRAGFSPGLVDGMSYNEIEKNFPQITKMMDVKVTTDARKDAMKMHNDQMISNRNEQNNFKLSQSDTKRLDTLGHMLNPQNASSRNGLGKDVAAYNTIQNVKALFNGEVNLDKLDDRQVTEVARVLDRVLSGGSPTVSGTEHLTPVSARQLIAKKLEFITSKRHGAGAGSFVESMKHTFEREEDIIGKRISESAKNDAGQYLDIAVRNPEAWDNMMAQKNLLDVLGSDVIKKQQSSGKKNRSEFENGISTAKTSQSDTVKVINSEGKLGTIPRAKLAAALKSGKFKQVGQ